MSLIRYLVTIQWASGRTLAYCAAASDERQAIELVTLGRDSAAQADILDVHAFAWAPELGGPRIKLDSPKAFRLKDPRTIEQALHALRVPTATVPKASEPSSNVRPRGPGSFPWRP